MIEFKRNAEDSMKTNTLAVALGVLAVIGVPPVAQSRQSPTPSSACGSAPVRNGLQASISVEALANGSLDVTRTICHVTSGYINVGIHGDAAFSVHLSSATDPAVATLTGIERFSAPPLSMTDAGSTFQDHVVFHSVHVPPGSYSVSATWRVRILSKEQWWTGVTLQSNQATVVIPPIAK